MYEIHKKKEGPMTPTGNEIWLKTKKKKINYKFYKEKENIFKFLKIK
jgi:hypothetical protein